jgi:hypothetical protein
MIYLDFRFPFNRKEIKNKAIIFELWDEDYTFKFDEDDLVG